MAMFNSYVSLPEVLYVYIANWKITMSDIGKSTIHCNFRCVKLPEGTVQERENSNGEDLNAWESLGRKLDVNGRWSYSIWVLFDCLVLLMGWFSFYTWLVVSNIFFVVPIILGMSSSQLTFIFFRGVGIPPTRLLLTIINHIITININHY